MPASSYLLLDRLRAATADEYIIEGELGRGGMAAVFLGRDIALDRRVAIKVMLPELAGVAGAEDRFVIEARTAAGLDHPGIVTVYAVKQRGGLTFIVMKYIEGQTLDRVLAARGALDPDVVASIGSHVAESLHFAHSRGVIHRDVKPSNIIIDTHGRPIVTDFGIAKVITAPSLTLAGSTVGTPGYMSPEQCRGLAVTAASDQYSLGVMLYELLTGAAPFSGTLFDLLKAHISDAAPPILAVKPEVDPALEAIVMIMLAKSETERFPSLRDVSNALGSLAPRRGRASDRQAIIAAVAPDVAPAPPVVTPVADASVPAFAHDTAAVEPHAIAQEPSAIAGGESARPGRNRTVAAIVVATVLLAAVGYAIASRNAVTKTASQPVPPAQAKVDSVAPTKPADSISAQKAETSLTVRADSASSKKSDTAAAQPAVAASKSNIPPAKTPPARPGRDSVGQTRRDSTGARCAALNLKFSLGEDMTRADTIFLRRECAKVRP
jgi:tRNA A-37 threonylcarbamoyl transferase component Bud32